MRIISILFFLAILPTITLNAQDSDSIIIVDEVTELEPQTGAYVVLKNDTLFSLHTYFGPYSPAERVESINSRLRKILDEYHLVSDSFSVIVKNDYSVISYMDYPIMSISEDDARHVGKLQTELAAEYLDIIKITHSNLLNQSTLLFWLIRIAYTLLAIAGLFLIIFIINKLFNWLNTKLESYEKGIKKKRKNIFKFLLNVTSDSILLLISKIVRIALIVFILFLYLPFMFSFLPWTQHLAQTFYGYIATPIQTLANGFIDFIPNIFAIAVIVIITRYFLRILVYIASEIEEDKLKISGFHRDWAKPTYNLVKILIYGLAMVFIFQYLPSSKAFQGVSIFVGVLFTLGSTSAIANMIAGIVITYMRPFAIGDRVKIGTTVGDVMEKNLLVTRLKTLKNEDITIPNATIINTHLWNYSRNSSNDGIILHPTVTIGYDVPPEKVISLLLEAAKNTKNMTREPKPFVFHKGLNDFYVEYELNVYSKQPKKMAFFYSELYRNIQIEFNKANIEILSPHYSAFRDGNASTIPDDTVETNPIPKNVITDVVEKLSGK